MQDMIEVLKEDENESPFTGLDTQYLQEK